MISPQCIHLVANKLTGLIERTFPREHALNLACNEERGFFTSDDNNNYKLLSCQTFVNPLFIFWIMVLLESELNFIDK